MSEDNSKIKRTIEWSSYEDIHKPTKGQDWFWSLGVISVFSAIASIILGNVLFGILILLAAGVIAMSANQEPRKNNYSVGIRGVTINGQLHPYTKLEAFWIDETHPKKDLLLLDTRKPLVPHIAILLPESLDKDALQDLLLDYLPEVELYESPASRIAELFGF